MNKYVKLALLGSALALAASPASAVDLCAGATTIDLPDGNSVPAWGYALGGSTGSPGVCVNTPTVPGPPLSVPAGVTTLTINLTNTLPESTSVVIPGLPMPTSVGPGPTWNDDTTGPRGGDPSKRVRSFGAEAVAGGTESYSWTGVRPGTFIYHSGTHPQKQVYMGLAGAVTQNAVDADTGILAQAYPGVEYVNEVVLFYSEIDPDLNAAVAGGTHETSIHYHPRWFLVNGAPYEDGVTPDIAAGAAGSRTLLRFLSTAGETHVPVLQGMHMTIHAEDGLQYNWQDGTTVMGAAPREQYSVMMPPLKTKDAIIRAPANGRYAVYDGNGYMTNPTSPDDVEAGDPVGGMLRFLAFGAADNQAPVADANGPYSGVTDAPVAFDGTGSTDDGAIVSYEWDFDLSNGIQVDATGPTPSHTYTSDNGGVPYDVTLTVTDDGPLADTATSSATITANLVPTADPNGPYNGSVGTPVGFDGTGSTDDSNIVSYAWDFGDTNTGTGATPSHTYTSVVGSPFTVTLTVTDDSGVSSTPAATTATIAANQLPIADPNGPYNGSTGVPVSFDGTGSSDPDGSVVSYAWDFGDGNSGVGATPSHSYAAAGIYPVELTVTDNAGGTSAPVTTTATIVAANQPPVADAGNPITESIFDQPVSFDGSGSSDPDGTIVTYDWDFGDGTPVAVNAGPTPSHPYTVASTYIVTLTVTDNDGATATDTVVASIVANQPPVAVDDTAAMDRLAGNQGATFVDLTSNDTDFEDGTVDPNSVVITSGPNIGSATAVTGGIDYTQPNGSGPIRDAVILTYTVMDSRGAVSNEATVTINIIR